MDEILIHKKTSIERCIKRINEDFQDDFLYNLTKQDAVILNIERACQAAIDMGTHLIKVKNLGLPQSNRDVFEKLEKNGIVPVKLSDRLKSMAGFRNLAIHDYSSMNIDVVVKIVKNNLKDLLEFADVAISAG